RRRRAPSTTSSAPSVAALRVSSDRDAAWAAGPGWNRGPVTAAQTGAHIVTRCWWAGTDPLYVRYHDEEWGRPVRDDRRLFEKICLEGCQAGLSWLTILRKRENFRAAFADFDFERVARFTARDVNRLLRDPGIVRHRGKIEAVISNAKQARGLVERGGSLAAFIWRYEPEPLAKPEVVATSPASIALPKELK